MCSQAYIPTFGVSALKKTADFWLAKAIVTCLLMMFMVIHESTKQHQTQEQTQDSWYICPFEKIATTFNSQRIYNCYFNVSTQSFTDLVVFCPRLSPSYFWEGCVRQCHKLHRGESVLASAASACNEAYYRGGKKMFDNELLLKNETFLSVISSFSGADKYFS